MIHTQLQNYTDKEAFEYIKEFYPTTFRKELQFPIQQIIGYCRIKRKLASAALDQLLRLVSTNEKRICLMAAYYLIKTKNTMEQRNLTLVKSEIYDYKEKLHSNEINKSCTTDKAVTREAIVKKIYQLENEVLDIYARQRVDPNIEVTGSVIKANGSELQI